MLKGFLTTLKGKIIVAAAGALVIAGVVVTVVAVTSPKDYRVIKIEKLNGQTIVTDSKNQEQDAYAGMNLQAGSTVEVKDGGNMTLLFDMDKYMFADEGTKFRVEASGNSEKSSTKTRIVLDEGSVLCRLDSKLGDEEIFEVETPNSVMSVRGTIFKMTIYKDENGENYARVDVLEGSVKVDLYNENGEKTGEEGLIEAGQAATVHSNPDLSEFVIGASDITYDDFSDVMASFVVETVDNGREICIGNDLFKHYTGLENHPETPRVIKEPTCGEEGEQEIYCSTCDAVIRTEPIEALEHTPGEWQPKTEGTCKEKATEALKCTICEEEIEVRELDLGNHNFGDWKVTTAAACEQTGEESRTCEICGKTETRTIAATDHNYGAWNVTAAANCENGGSQSHTCSTCGKSESQATAALGHLFNHTSEYTHRIEGTDGPLVVGGTCNICVYLHCLRCGNSGERVDSITGTIESMMSGQVTNATCNICGASAY